MVLCIRTTSFREPEPETEPLREPETEPLQEPETEPLQEPERVQALQPSCSRLQK